MITIIDMFEQSVAKYTDNAYMWEKKVDKFIPTSYIDTKKSIYNFAAGLVSLNFKKGDKLALLSEGRNDWIISELATLYIGGVCVPLSVKLEEQDVKFRIQHSDSKIIIVSKQQIKLIENIINELPNIEYVILLDDVNFIFSKTILKDDLISKGKELLQSNPNIIVDLSKKVELNDVACISYTSGTTAEPKGIMLSHRNFTANVEQAQSRMYMPAYYISLLILPLDHSFAHTCGIFTFMKFGASVATVQVGDTPMQTLRNIKTNIGEIKPNILLSVPALAKNFRKGIEDGLRKKGMLGLFNYALSISYKYNKEGYNKGAGFKFWLKPQMFIFEKILFSKIRAFFGGNLDFFIGGGALLDIELQRFYYAIGIPMLQGYGLTEATPIISANSMINHKLGSSGLIVDFLDLKICNNEGVEVPHFKKGEIVIKGENVMLGYWKNEKATSETIRNGWLYTGDMGYVDDDNFLYVLGRFKSLLIGSDGEKYSPEQIEEGMSDESKYIDQCMLYNDQNPYTTSLIVPNKLMLLAKLESKKLDPNSDEGCEYALKIIKKEIDSYKSNGKRSGKFPERWVPTTFGILDEHFSEKNKFLNSTLKMVRRNITKCFEDLIKYMYTSEGRIYKNKKNIKSMKLLLNS